MYKNFLYLFLISIVAFFLYKEYTYIIPYNRDPFYSLFVPDTTPFNISWIVIMIVSVVLSLPVLFKRKIGFLGVILLIIASLKPYFLSEFPVESQFAFFRERKIEMLQLVKKYKHRKNCIIESSDVKDLGFEQLDINGDSYNFVVHSLLDYGYGFTYDSDEKLPEYAIAFSSVKGKIEKHWYYF